MRFKSYKLFKIWDDNPTNPLNIGLPLKTETPPNIGTPLNIKPCSMVGNCAMPDTAQCGVPLSADMANN